MTENNYFPSQKRPNTTKHEICENCRLTFVPITKPKVNGHTLCKECRDKLSNKPKKEAKVKKQPITQTRGRKRTQQGQEFKK